MASAGPYANHLHLCSGQITTPAPNHWIFLQAGCFSWRPTNSVKEIIPDDVEEEAANRQQPVDSGSSEWRADRSYWCQAVTASQRARKWSFLLLFFTHSTGKMILIDGRRWHIPHAPSSTSSAFTPVSTSVLNLCRSRDFGFLVDT